MPATTPGGWPYVLPADHPLEYPAASQSLANLLDTRAPANVNSLLTPSASWADYGGPFAGMYVTKANGMVTVEAALKRTADLAVTAGTGVTVATIAAGSRPARQVLASCLVALNGPPTFAGCRIDYGTNGAVIWYPAASGTLTAAAGLLAFTVTYRQGN